MICNLYILRLHGSDVILGVQWLKTMGTIIWNFEELTMAFTHQGRQYTLHWIKNPMVESVGRSEMCIFVYSITK